MKITQDVKSAVSAYLFFRSHAELQREGTELIKDCPALTAKQLQAQSEQLIIDSAAEMLGENKDFRHTLLCSGLKEYHKFINMVVGLVVKA